MFRNVVLHNQKNLTQINGEDIDYPSDQSFLAGSSGQRWTLWPAATLKTMQKGKTDIGEMLRVYFGHSLVCGKRSKQSNTIQKKESKLSQNRSNLATKKFRNIFQLRINLFHNPFDIQLMCRQQNTRSSFTELCFYFLSHLSRPAVLQLTLQLQPCDCDPSPSDVTVHGGMQVAVFPLLEGLLV